MRKSEKKQEKKSFAKLSPECRDQIEDEYIVIPFSFTLGGSNPGNQLVMGYVLI